MRPPPHNGTLRIHEAHEYSMTVGRLEAGGGGRSPPGELKGRFRPGFPHPQLWPCDLPLGPGLEGKEEAGGGRGEKMVVWLRGVSGGRWGSGGWGEDGVGSCPSQAPAVQILPPQPSCPNTPGPAPSLLRRLPGPFLPDSLLPSSPTHPHLPRGAGEAARGRGNGRGRMGEGSSRGARQHQPQPPLPHDLHRREPQEEGGERGR